jgi:hypothetical protein
MQKQTNKQTTTKIPLLSFDLVTANSFMAQQYIQKNSYCKLLQKMVKERIRYGVSGYVNPGISFSERATRVIDEV